MVLVTPDTVVRWHRQGWRLFWRWKSRPQGADDPISAPRCAERVIGTLRWECLDHLIVLDEQHLRSMLTEFVRYYNEDRPHRTLGLQTLELRPRATTGPIQSRPVLNGLHHAYERAG